MLDADFDDGDVGDGAVAEALHVDVEAIGIEAGGDIEGEARGDGGADGWHVSGREGDQAGGVIDYDVGCGLCDAGDGDEDCASDRFCDGALRGVRRGLRRWGCGGWCRGESPAY